MPKVLAACVSCGNFIEQPAVGGFVAQGGRCASCAATRKLAGKFGSLLIMGMMTQQELAALKREFYQLYQIDKTLEIQRAEFLRHADEEMNRVIAETEEKVGRPIKELRDRKKQLEAQLKAYMEESKTAEMVLRDLLVELRDTVVNRGNMPQYKTIVEDLRSILEWSEEEMEVFVRARYSQPVTAPIMTVKPLPPKTPKKTPGKPVASKIARSSAALLRNILWQHRSSGGGTFDLNGKNLLGQALYAVSIYPQREMPLDHPLTAEDIDNYIEANMDLLNDPSNKLGTWRNPTNGRRVLDVSFVTPNLEEAMALGRKHNQDAIFDLKARKEIWLKPGMGEPTTEPTASRRTAVEQPPAFQQVDGQTFYTAINEMQKRKEFLSPYKPEEFNEMRCFLNQTGNAGYCITPDNEIVSVFNNSGQRGVGQAAMHDAFNNGGEHGTAFDGFLPGYYKGLGMEEFDRAPFDSNMKPPDWDETAHGRPDVVFLRRKREPNAPVAAYRLQELTLPHLAYIHTDFLRTASGLCKIETPEKVFILTGERVKENGLHTMISLQAQTKATLRVADVEHKDDDTLHVLVEGRFAFDPNTLRAFLAERLSGYEIAETYYDSPERVAVELQPAAKLANDPMAAAMAFFTSMFDTVQNLLGLERQRYEAAQMILGETTGANQMDLPDNEEDLALKYERQNVNEGGGSADGGIMSPNGGAPLISTGT